MWRNRNGASERVGHTLMPVSQKVQIDPELDGRSRLVYWVRQRMRDLGIKSVRSLAHSAGIPESNAARWLGDGGSGGVPLIWLADLCRVLRVDPAWFTMLPPIPEDPLAPYTLAENDPLLAVLDAARLARRDLAGEVAAIRPAATQRPSRPRKRASSGSR